MYLVIPSGALSDDAEVNIEPHSEYILGDEFGTYLEEVQYDFGPEGTTLQAIKGDGCVLHGCESHAIMVSG